MRSKLDLAELEIWAALIAVLVDSWIYLGIGLGPEAWEGQVGEK